MTATQTASAESKPAEVRATAAQAESEVALHPLHAAMGHTFAGGIGAGDAGDTPARSIHPLAPFLRNVGNQAVLRATRASSSDELPVQRKCACESCSDCPSTTDEIEVQTKLEIDTPGDRWEMEADRIADAIVLSKSPRASAPGTRHDASVPAIPVQPLSVSIHRTALPNATGANEGGDGIDGTIVSRLGKGASLPPSTRAFMEGRLQSDLSSVRIHTDTTADSLNTALHSYAFTSGCDVFFANGQYSPGTVEGDRLLAHELVHTVQQGASPRRIQRQNWGDIRHEEIQTLLRAANDDLITEAPIPGAAPSKSKSSPIGRPHTNRLKVGFADVYKADNQVISGVKGVDTPFGFDNMSASDKSSARGKKIRFAPELSRGKWVNVPGFPQNFAIGEIKPILTPSDRGQSYSRQLEGAVARFVLGRLQPHTLIDGFGEIINEVYSDPAFRAELTKRHASAPPNTKGRMLDFGDPNEVKIPPQMDYRDFVNQVNTTHDIPTHRNTNYGPHGRTRLWVYPNPDPGLLQYFDLCHPFPVADRGRINQLIAGLNDLRHRSQPARPGAVPKIKKAKPGTPAIKVQRKIEGTPDFADPKLQTGWSQWKVDFTDWNKGNPGKRMPGAEQFLKSGDGALAQVSKLEIDKETHAHSSPTADEKNLSLINHWSKSKGVFGWLRFAFGGAFQKIYGFISNFLGKVNIFRSHPETEDVGVSSGWEAKALKLIKKLFVTLAKEFAKSAYNLVASCVGGVINAVFDSLLDDVIEEVREKFENNEFVDKLKDYYEQFENLHKKFKETYEPILDTISKALDTFRQIVDTLNILTQIERAIRILVQAISCATPPALGCLWGLIAQVAFEEVAGAAVDSALFENKVARPVANQILEATVAGTLRKWLNDFFKGVGLGEFVVKVPECSFSTGLPGRGSTNIDTSSFTSDNPEVQGIRAKVEKANAPHAMVEDLQKVLTDGGKPATEAEIKDLVRIMQQSSDPPDEILKKLKSSKGSGKQGDGANKIDIGQAEAQLSRLGAMTSPQIVAALEKANWSKVKGPGQFVVDHGASQSFLLAQLASGERVGALIEGREDTSHRGQYVIVDSSDLVSLVAGQSAGEIMIPMSDDSGNSTYIKVFLFEPLAKGEIILTSAYVRGFRVKAK